MSVNLTHAKGEMRSHIDKPLVNDATITIPHKSIGSDIISSDSASTTKKRSVDDFQFLACIGEGSYSKVYRALSKKNHVTYAVKVLNKQHIHKEKKRKYVTIEKNTLNLLGKHPGIVTLYYTFQDPKSLYFVIDFAPNGELLTLIHNLETLSLELTRYYTIQLIDTICYIHSKGIIHRDLKPENILLNANWNLMITDFGAAKFINEIASDVNEDDNSSENPESNGSFVGTAEYISPELLRHNQSSCGSDFWALGCIIYQMIVGKPPFKAQNEYQTFERIVDLDYSFPDPREYYIPSYVINIVRDLLAEDPNERLGADGIKTYSWFKGVDWNDKSLIWGKVPLLRPYNPAEVASTHNFSKASMVPTPPKGTKSVSTKPVSHVDYQKHALKKQILNAESNTKLMNKVNSRINTAKLAYEKKENPSTARTIDQLNGLDVNTKRAIIKPPILSSKTSAPPTNTPSHVTRIKTSVKMNGTSVTKSALQENSTKPFKTDIKKENFNSPQELLKKGKRASQVSFSSLLTNGESSKSVVIKSETEKSQSNENQKVVKTSNHNAPITASPKLASITKKTYSPTPYSTIGKQNSRSTLTIPKQRVPSSEATAAAGAIGTLLTHNRTINSANSTAEQHKQLLYNRHKRMINPVLLDKKIPASITSKLMYQESILKLDNIYKSEINHRANQFTRKGETLDHTTLENIIRKYERDLEKDLKSCIMVITSFARVFIYELNDTFYLNNPQSAIQMQAQEFYQKAMEIKLTNKNVSLYDYEFDEDMHEGYLILELANVNKLIFLSAWDRSKLMKGGIDSNVRIGFNVNDSETWINAFLNARKMLKKRELASQHFKNISKKEQFKSTKDSSNQSSFRSKLGTRLRSLSGSNQKEAALGSRVQCELGKDIKQNGNISIPGSHSNSVINSVKELTQGVRMGFRKDSDDSINKLNYSLKNRVLDGDVQSNSVQAPLIKNVVITGEQNPLNYSQVSKVKIVPSSKATTAATITFGKK